MKLFVDKLRTQKGTLSFPRKQKRESTACAVRTGRKATEHMQFDEQQNVDPSSGQETPFDPFRQAAGDQSDDVINDRGNRVPGAQPYTGQAQQAAGQGSDALQQQGQQGLSQAQPDQGNLGDTLQQQSQPGLGGMGEMVGNQANQPGQASPTGASADPNNPYGDVDDVIANYGNTQNDQGQQGITNV